MPSAASTRSHSAGSSVRPSVAAGLAERDEEIIARAAHLDVHEAALLLLHAVAARRAPAEGGVYRERGVTYERGLAARREEAQPQLVIGRIRRKHEGGVDVAELARDGACLVFGEVLGAQHHRGRIAGEAGAGKRIDVRYLDPAMHVATPLRLANEGREANIAATLGWRDACA